MKVFILFTFIWSSCVLSAEYTIQRQDGSDINYYFSVDKPDETFSIFLVLQGSSCRSVHSSHGVSGFLKQNKLARLDIEKYGITKNTQGCPSSYLKNNNIFRRSDDIKAVLDEIRITEEYKNWDGVVHIVGGSEGAVVAPIAAYNDSRVKSISLLAGAGGMTMADELKLIVKKGTRMCGIQSPLEFEAAFQKIFNQPTSTRTWCGKTNSFSWWSRILYFKPIDLLTKLDISVYVAHGTEDSATPVESSDLSYAEFQKLGKTNMEYSRYEGLNHYWQDQAGSNQSAKVFGDYFAWLSKILSNQ